MAMMSKAILSCWPSLSRPDGTPGRYRAIVLPNHGDTGDGVTLLKSKDEFAEVSPNDIESVAIGQMAFSV